MIEHVAIIMDGNGRWAKTQGLPRTDGHRQGAKKVIEILNTVADLGIKYLTLYAFSTENWKRPILEVNTLMNLLEEFLAENEKDLMKRDYALNIIGQIDKLPRSARKKAKEVIENTKNNKTGIFTLALSYGGRAEIVDAVNKILEESKTKKLKITEKTFRNYLYSPHIPDPDLLIRTGGDFRISNFLLWQISYSEIYVTETMWPDFTTDEFKHAIDNFGKRQRRFGATGEQVTGEQKC